MNVLTILGYDNSLVRLWLRVVALQKKCRLECGPYAWDLSRDSRVIRINRSHFVNVGRLAEDFDSYFETLLPVQNSNATMLDFSRLHIHTYRRAGLEFECAKWPELDAPINAYFKVFPLTGKGLTFDLGAEYGFSTYLLSKFGGRVVAFEQEMAVRTILERNMRRHALANVAVVTAPVSSLALLVQMYGEPSFCKINLDRVPLSFFWPDAQLWASHAIFMAARSNSRHVRLQFAEFLQNSGFRTSVDHELRMVWASPGAIPPKS